VNVPPTSTPTAPLRLPPPAPCGMRSVECGIEGRVRSGEPAFTFGRSRAHSALRIPHPHFIDPHSALSGVRSKCCTARTRGPQVAEHAQRPHPVTRSRTYSGSPSLVRSRSENARLLLQAGLRVRVPQRIDELRDAVVRRPRIPARVSIARRTRWLACWYGTGGPAVPRVVRDIHEEVGAPRAGRRERALRTRIRNKMTTPKRPILVSYSGSVAPGKTRRPLPQSQARSGTGRTGTNGTRSTNGHEIVLAVQPDAAPLARGVVEKRGVVIDIGAHRMNATREKSVVRPARASAANCASHPGVSASHPGIAASGHSSKSRGPRASSARDMLTSFATRCRRGADPISPGSPRSAG